MNQFRRFVLSGLLIACPLLVYVASYVVLVRQRPLLVLTVTVKPGQPPPTMPRGLSLVPYYRFGGRLAEVVYRPLAGVDQQLFPQRWVVTPEELERIARNKTN